MSRPPALTLCATAVGALLVCAAGILLALTRTRSQTVPATSAVTTVVSRAPARQVPSSVGNGALLAAIRRFAIAYGVYLNGGSAVALTHAGSLTATAQATQGGQIPSAFRDGNVVIVELDSLESTCCSASATVVLANREERYPFAEQLLLEQRGWVVDQITPPDLSIDRNLRPAPHVALPAGGTAAAKTFAVAYVNYRSGRSQSPPAMTAAAAHQIIAGTDSLTGEILPKAAARLTSIQFGPPSGNEFAATATVRGGSVPLRFSFLMVKTNAGWECGQYL
jgi:hypothetical protein